MAIVRTPDDLGHLIRQRRKALSWDQATLAHRVGVSRRWIIEIEKGKPAAALNLVLRTLNVLGLQLDAASSDAESGSVQRSSGAVLQLPDIDQIISRRRVQPAARVMGTTARGSGPEQGTTRGASVREPSATYRVDGTDAPAEGSVTDLVNGWLAKTTPAKPSPK